MSTWSTIDIIKVYVGSGANRNVDSDTWDLDCVQAQKHTMRQIGIIQSRSNDLEVRTKTTRNCVFCLVQQIMVQNLSSYF